MCYCIHGYTGNPMVQCVVQQGINQLTLLTENIVK